jgi:hypothetical protein
VPLDFAEQRANKSLQTNAQKGGVIAMSAPNVPQQVHAEELNRRLEELHQQLEEMNQAVESALSRGHRRRPALMFPFSVLDRLVNRGLLALERAVGRLVKAVIR